MFGTSRTGWIGIEWGTQTLKLAQVERTKRGLRLTASALVTSRPGCLPPEELLSTSPRWSAQDLQTAIALNPGFSGRRVACVLPMHLTDLRP